MELTGSAAAYLEQATLELSQNIAFSSKEEFAEWLSLNFDAIVLRGLVLNRAVIKKVSSGDGVKVKHLLATKVWEASKQVELRERANLEFNHALSNKNS